MESLRTNAIALLMVVVAGLVVFAPGLQGGFIFDDLPNLVHAQGWKAVSLEPDALAAAAASGLTSDGGRPLAMLSFAVNHALTGLDPWWLKATSLGMHLLNGLLVMALARRMLAAGTSLSGRAMAISSALVAIAWLVHPVQVSTVAYAVQRMEIGAATGVLVSLVAYLGFRDRQLAGGVAWPWLGVAAAGTAFGLGFKESAAIAPLLALLLELLCFGFGSRTGQRDRRLVAAFAFGAVVALAAFVALVLPLTSAAAYATRPFDAVSRTFTQFPVLCDYLTMIARPRPDAFRFYYDDYTVSNGLLDPRTAGAIAVLATLVAVTWLLRRRLPLLPFGIAWFLACHAITSSPIPLELAFEHRNYLAALGPIVALAGLLERATRRLHPDARAVVAALPVAALAVLGTLQSATWGDSLRLAWTLENRAPHSPRAAYGLGVALVETARGDRSSPAWSMGMATLQRAAALPAASPLPTQALIVLSAKADIHPPTGTWDRFRGALLARPLGPEATEALFAVNACRINARCPLDDRELLATHLAVVGANPADPVAHTLYANFAWNVLGDRTLAIAMQREAVALSGGAPAHRLALARFLLANSRQGGGPTTKR